MTLARVRQLPGIRQVTGELSSATLVVTFEESQVTVEQIVRTVEEIGYGVEGTFDP